MFAAIIAIVAALVVVAGIAYFIYDKFEYINSFFEWAQSVIDSISSAFPDWLLPFIAIALVLAIIGILVKLL